MFEVIRSSWQISGDFVLFGVQEGLWWDKRAALKGENFEFILQLQEEPHHEQPIH